MNYKDGSWLHTPALKFSSITFWYLPLLFLCSLCLSKKMVESQRRGVCRSRAKHTRRGTCQSLSKTGNGFCAWHREWSLESGILPKVRRDQTWRDQDGRSLEESWPG